MPARTLKMHDQLEKLAATDFEMLARMQNVHDVMAGDVLYHIRVIMRTTSSSKPHRTSRTNVSLYMNSCGEISRHEYTINRQYWCLIAGHDLKSCQYYFEIRFQRRHHHPSVSGSKRQV